MDQTAMPMQAPEIADHLNHVSYPASKQDLVEACEKMSDVPKEDKDWFMKALPEKTYGSADEVKQTLGLNM